MKYECENTEQIRETANRFETVNMVDLEFNNAGVSVPLTTHKGIYSNSNDQVYGVVTNGYNLLKHKDFLLAVGSALERLNIKYKAEIIDEGAKLSGFFKFQNHNFKFDKLNEGFATGIKIMNSYNQSSGVQIATLYTRLACMNGMVLTSAKDMYSLRHNSNKIKEIEAFAEQRINEIITNNNELQIYVSDCMKDSIEWKIASKILRKLLFNIDRHAEKILDKLGVALVITKDKKTKKKKIEYVLNDNKVKNPKLTRWDIYNAITSYTTHTDQLTPHVRNRMHITGEKVLKTPLNRLQEKYVEVEAPKTK